MSDVLSELRGRLYFDQDVPVQLAGMLRSRGIDALTTLEAGRLDSADADQIVFASSQNRAILTHNRLHFEALHLHFLQVSQTHSGVLIAVQRRDLRITVERVLDLLNRLDREQLRSGLFYV